MTYKRKHITEAPANHPVYSLGFIVGGNHSSRPLPDTTKPEDSPTESLKPSEKSTESTDQAESDVSASSGDNSEWESTMKAATAYARAYNTLDMSDLKDLLSDDIKYFSQLTLINLKGKDEFIEFLHLTADNIRISESVLFAEIARGTNYSPFLSVGEPCVVIAVNSIENTQAVVILKTNDGLISDITSCAIPSPESVERTGIYPTGGN